MSEALKAKIRAAIENPNVPMQLTPVETAELDAYLALVTYSEQGQNGQIGRA